MESSTDVCSSNADCHVDSTADAMAHLTKVYIAGLLILGLFGNVYCVTAFLMPVFRRVPSTLYLAALALSDIGFLTTLGLMWMRSIGLRFLDMPHVCTTCMFLSYFCCFVSSWLVFAITLERYILASGSHGGCCRGGCNGGAGNRRESSRRGSRAGVSSKHGRVRVTFVIIVLFGLLVNSWVIFTADSVVAGGRVTDGPGANGTRPTDTPPGPAICDLSEAAAGQWAIFNALDMIFSFTLPFLGVLVLNAKIGFRVCKAQSLVRRHQSEVQTGTSTMGNVEEQSMLRREQMGSLNYVPSSIGLDRLLNDAELLARVEGRAGLGPTGRNRRARRGDRIERKVTQLLVTVSLAYLILNLPSYLHRIVFTFESSAEGDVHQENLADKSSFQIISETIAYLMFYTQYSINFFLYSCHGCMFGFNC